MRSGRAPPGRALVPWVDAGSARGGRRSRQARRRRRAGAGRSAPSGSCSPKRTKPAAIGTALVARVASPAAGESVAVLEGALEDAGAEGVADDQADDGDEPDAAVDDELGGDVAAGEEQPGREPERRPAGEPGSRTAPRIERAGGGAAEPEHDRRSSRVDRSAWRGADEGEREEDEPGDGDQHGDLLAACEPARGGRARWRARARRCRRRRRPGRARAGQGAARPRRRASRPSRCQSRPASAGSREQSETNRRGRRAENGGIAAAASCSRE